MLIDSLLYVTTVPYFWATMGLVVSCAMFVGAVLYNGDIKALVKGLITIGIYAMFLFFVSLARITGAGAIVAASGHPYTAYAGLITILLITFFYILGMALGVLTTCLAHNRCKSSAKC